jgi:hypothetical protein
MITLRGMLGLLQPTSGFLPRFVQPSPSLAVGDRDLVALAASPPSLPVLLQLLSSLSLAPPCGLGATRVFPLSPLSPFLAALVPRPFLDAVVVVVVLR